MQAPNMSDTGSLADSAYEFIQGTDTESHDGGLSESTGSLSISRPDDVHSLDGSASHYRSDSDEEADHSSRASSIRYADQTLQNPSTQLPTNTLEYGSSTEGSGVVVRSIELQERDGDEEVLLDNISAMHAVQEFNEQESSALAQHLGLTDAPKRLVATIRQTMSPAYLSTKEPLRVLFVGRADAQRSVVLKICSAIWASPKIDSDDQDHFKRHHDGVYNIVPISSFGPNPELDLMEASHYQIKVEHCTSAEMIADDQTPWSGEPLIKLTIDQEKTYQSSLVAGFTPLVRPKWDLPHVAIFYCTNQDDAAAERTREAVWSFMKRHGLPSIFIADRPSFINTDTEPWDKYIEEHSLHLCIESRDPERPMPPKRFPIDYASFAEIDARQMNRNLAYLTRLSDADEMASDQEVEFDKSDLELSLKPQTALDRTKRAFVNLVERHGIKELVLSLLIPFLVSMVVPLLIALFAGWPPSGTRSVTTTPPGVCVPPPKHPEGITSARTSSVVTSTTTVVINVTSTKTVQVSQAKPSTSTLASALSFAGFLSDKPSAAASEPEVKRPSNSPKKTVCSVRVYSPTELLVVIPSRNKAVWLAQGAIDIDVRRDDKPVKNRISSVDEGVLIELAPRDAHGVLNVSVVTTRKPKINETFRLDFGKSVVGEAFDAGMLMLQDAINKISTSVDEASHYFEDAMKMHKEAAAALEQLSENIRNGATGAAKRASDNVREHMARHLEAAETFRKEADLSILQAQITSRLWWLKLQGKTEEYAEYQRNASRFLKAKRDELLKRSAQDKEKRVVQQTRLLHVWRGPSLLRYHGARLKRDEVKQAKSREEGRENRLWKEIFGV
ncbi:hypothetical protein VTI74DRAFT_4138 [Chaetomium olivicolor]